MNATDVAHNAPAEAAARETARSTVAAPTAPLSSVPSRPSTPAPARGKSSLAAKLTLWYVVSTAVLLALSAALLYGGLRRSTALEDDRFLGHLLSVVRELLREHAEDSAEVKWEIESEWAARDLTRVYVRLLDTQGRVTAQTPGMDEQLAAGAFPPPPANLLEAGFIEGRDAKSPRGRPFRVISAAAKTREGHDRIVQIALDETMERAQLARYLRGAWLVLALGVALSAVLGYVLARKSIQPVRQITDAARRVRSTTLHERLDVTGLPAELSSLAATFNEMLDRLQDAFARLSQFSADIAHELRTPVNNLRGEAEVALSKARSPQEYRAALESSLEESERLARMIEALLFLARAEDPRTQVRRERVDVRRELERAREFYEPAAAEKRVAIVVADSDTSGGGDAIEAWVDRTLLQRALYNLIDNALAHTSGDGAEIALSAARENGVVAVTVADTGCGIAPEHLPRVFDRFYRCDRSRTATTATGNTAGAGLGLSIVQSIARLHGGGATITSRAGRGTRVTLSFPGDIARPAADPVSSGAVGTAVAAS